MDARVEAALVCVLDRAESGADVSEEWLRATYPDCWGDLAEFLTFLGRLQRGRPRLEALGPYRILRRLGQGGMGAVYVARVERAHEGLAPGTHVAVKVVHRHLLDEPGFLQRTLREARLGRSVVHRSVVRTLDAGVATSGGAEEVYLVTEYVEGRNLRGLLHETSPVPEHLCRTIARGVLEELVAIHAAGIVHRDVKPENVVIAGTGEATAVKVMDLGAARPAEELARLSGAAEFAGSIPYAAPEQFLESAAVDGRADLYALGVTLHELATGRHPSAAGTARRRAASHGVSAFFAAFVDALRAESPADRFASAAAALEVLDDAEASAWWRERGRHVRVAAAAEPAAFVGRAAELASLADAAARAFAGRGGSFVLEGDAGAGKSRLLLEFTSRCRDAAVLSASGAAGPADALVAAVRAVGGGEPAPTPEGLAAAIRALAAARPVLVTVEDLHAVSPEGRKLLAAVASAVRGSRTLIAATTRPGAASPFEDAERIAVGRLASEATRALVAAATAPEPPGATLTSLAEHWSGGNPFFVLEILAALRDDGLLTAGPAGGWRLCDGAGAPEIPDTLRELVRARIEALSGDDRALLDAAACCGVSFDPADVAAALGVAPVLAAERLARLERRHGLVKSDGARCAFDHPLVHETVAEATLPEVAARLHASLAAALERAGDAGGRAARHFLLAGDAARAAPRLAPALRSHAAERRFDAIVELCELALACGQGPAGALRLTVLRAKAEALGLLARRAEELGALRRAMELATVLADADAVAELRPQLARSLHAAGRHDDAVAEARRALADAAQRGDEAAAREAHAVLATVLGHVGREEEALAHAVAHLDRCGDARDTERRVAAYVLVAEALRHLNRLTEAHARLESAVAAARDLDPGLAAVRRAHLLHAKSLTALGRIDEAAPLLDRAVAAARACADRGEEISALEALALVRSRLGEWDAAVAAARAAADFAGLSGDADALADAFMRCASVVKWSGRYGEALAHYDRALAVCERHGYALGQVTTRAYRAIQLAHLGEFRRARDDAEKARDLALAHRFDTVLSLVHRALGLTTGADAAPDLASLREAARLAAADIQPPVRAEILLALAAAEFHGGAPSAESARAALHAATAANLPAVGVVAAAYLAALGETPAEAARAALAAHERRLPVARRLEARFVLWRITSERALLDAARRDLAILRHGAASHGTERFDRTPLVAALAAAQSG